MNPMSILSFLAFFLLSGVPRRIAEAVRGGDPREVVREIVANALALAWLCAALSVAFAAHLARLAAGALTAAVREAAAVAAASARAVAALAVAAVAYLARFAAEALPTFDEAPADAGAWFA